MNELEVLRSIDAASAWAERVRAAGLSLGLVPTMGALHAGHLSLIDRALRECDRVAVTIFVNPTQFCPGEDLDAYPRTEEADISACRERGVDLVLAGGSTGEGAVYADGFQTWVRVEEISEPLCGRSRPGHFRGVATVVAILFGAFRPNRAYFGAKDYQQARLIERLAVDLKTGVDVRVLPTIREPDGLAMSSRNAYLSDDERARALALPRALERARRAFDADADGSVTAESLEAIVRDALASGDGDGGAEESRTTSVPFETDYVEVLDARTLEPTGARSVRECRDGVVVAAAVRVGATRLIDNVRIGGVAS